MKDTTMSITDLILLVACSLIACSMLISGYRVMYNSVIEVQSEDKTALKNYTGYALNSFDYTQNDAILAIAIGDQYEPGDNPKLKWGNTLTVDATISTNSTDDNVWANLYINQDRATYMSNNNVPAPSTNKIKFVRYLEGDTYIWSVMNK